MRKIDMRIIGCIVIAGILFSYIPVISIDECPEGNHKGNMKLDCGNNFHCPLIFTVTTAETLPLPLSGRVVLIPSLLKIDELIVLIFRPPKRMIFKTQFYGGREFLL
jgi:hypothetical protein